MPLLNFSGTNSKSRLRQHQQILRRDLHDRGHQPVETKLALRLCFDSRTLLQYPPVLGHFQIQRFALSELSPLGLLIFDRRASAHDSTAGLRCAFEDRVPSLFGHPRDSSQSTNSSPERYGEHSRLAGSGMFFPGQRLFVSAFFPSRPANPHARAAFGAFQNRPDGTSRVKRPLKLEGDCTERQAI